MRSFIKFLSRNKLYASIEALGLAVSLAFVIIIGSYIFQQYAVTRENSERKSIYAFGMPNYLGLTYGFPDALAASIPEIEEASRVTMVGNYRIKLGDKALDADIMATDAAFFDLFPYYGFVSGGPALLEDKSNALVSESFAKQYSVLPGQSLVFSTSGGATYIVAGIFKDFEASLFPDADIIVPANSAVNQGNIDTPFDHYGCVICFAKVAKGTVRDALYRKAENVCKEVYPDIYGQSFLEHLWMPRLDELFFAQADTQLNKGDKGSLRILSIAGLLLLLSAVFNYINLNFALLGKRAREMATRRLVGASRQEIVWKYITESIFFTVICFLVSLLLAAALAPMMNSLLNDPSIPVRIECSPLYVLSFGLLILLVGSLSGLLPALVAGRFKPMDIVNGTFRTRSKMVFSKVFIVLQSALAVFLISMALLMEAQYRKSLDRPKHADIADKYYLFSGRPADLALMDAMRELPCVSRVGACFGAPGIRAGGQYSNTRDGGEILYYLSRMDSTAFSMLHFEVLKDYGAPLYNSVWFGKSAFDATGFDDVHHDIGGTLALRTSGCEQSAGVIADCPNAASNRGKEEYQVVSVVRLQDINWPGLLIETLGPHKEAEAAILAAFKAWDTSGMAPLYVSSYLEDNYLQALKPGRNNMRLLEIFMVLAVIISLLGLLAMSTYFASSRSGDIAVRKVFGDTVAGVLFTNVKDYIVMVG